MTISNSTPSDGEHGWAIPTNLAESSNYKVRITSTSNSSLYDYSNNYFTIYLATGWVTDIDDNLYQTRKIGDQWWMVTNLRVTHYRNGDPIPHKTSNNDWTSTSSGAYCVYDNNSSNAYIYGNLYNWYALDDSRGIAPEGWHVPTDSEWQALVDYLGGSSVAGGKMKTTGTIEGGDGLWHEPNTDATNESGFTAFPGGTRHDYGSFEYVGYYALFWSYTEYGSYSYYRQLYYDCTIVHSSFRDRRYGFSVRCVKD